MLEPMRRRPQIQPGHNADRLPRCIFYVVYRGSRGVGKLLRSLCKLLATVMSGGRVLSNKSVAWSLRHISDTVPLVPLASCVHLSFLYSHSHPSLHLLSLHLHLSPDLIRSSMASFSPNSHPLSPRYMYWIDLPPGQPSTSTGSTSDTASSRHSQLVFPMPVTSPDEHGRSGKTGPLHAFPRTSWPDMRSWCHPTLTPPSFMCDKLFWAAREASKRWSTAGEKRVSIDHFKLAVLDRSMEL